jgi:2-polyprenyl-6-methoxyphenol hydroxylase-like FAD-dependent oxidoreductase
MVVGGSIAGLLAARALRARSAEVTIFERAKRLEDRGTSLMLDPQVACFIPGLCFRVYGERMVLDRELRLRWRRPVAKAACTWGELYRSLLAGCEDSLCLDQRVDGCVLQGESVVVTTRDGARHSGDLVIGADGIGSTIRQGMDLPFEPSYCGYVALRGTVDAGAAGHVLPWLWREVVAGRLINVYGTQTHCVLYSPAASGPQLNWMWYFNVPEAELSQWGMEGGGPARRWSVPPHALTAAMRHRLHELAAAEWPESLASLFALTPAPSLQAIYAGAPEKCAVGRMVLVGDAAHVLPPHLGAATSLAMADVSSLVNALAAGTSLSDWSEGRHAAVTRDLALSVRWGKAMQTENHRWEEWSCLDFQKWWEDLTHGHRPYFEAAGNGLPLRL